MLKCKFHVWVKGKANTADAGRWRQSYSTFTYADAQSHASSRCSGQYQICGAGQDPNESSDLDSWAQGQSETIYAPRLQLPVLKTSATQSRGDLPEPHTWPVRLPTADGSRLVSVDLPSIAQSHRTFYRFGGLAGRGHKVACQTHANAVVDLRSSIAQFPLPVCVDHNPDRISGLIMAAKATDSIICAGVLWDLDVVHWAKSLGHRIGLSAGWGTPLLNGEQYLGKGRNEIVNGNLVHGPVTIFRNARFRELSVTDSPAYETWLQIDPDPITECPDLSPRPQWLYQQ